MIHATKIDAGPDPMTMEWAGVAFTPACGGPPVAITEIEECRLTERAGLTRLIVQTSDANAYAALPLGSRGEIRADELHVYTGRPSLRHRLDDVRVVMRRRVGGHDKYGKGVIVFAEVPAGEAR